MKKEQCGKCEAPVNDEKYFVRIKDQSIRCVQCFTKKDKDFQKVFDKLTPRMMPGVVYPVIDLLEMAQELVSGD